jgi:hypothetical protein
MMLDSPPDQALGPTSQPTLPPPANLIETNTPEISVPELLERVQEEVARHRTASLQNSSEHTPGSHLETGRRSRSYRDWDIITAYLGIAEKNAVVGKHVPEMKRFPGPIRMIARFLGGCFLYPLRMITNPQREFNCAVLIALWTMQDGVRQLEKAHQRALDDLIKRQLDELRKSLQEQQRRLDTFFDEARRKAG